MASFSKDYPSDSDILDLEVEERIEALETLKRKRDSNYLICASCPDSFKLFKSARRFVRHEEYDHILNPSHLMTDKDNWLNPNLVVRKLIPLEDMSPLFSSESESDEDDSILSEPTSESDTPEISADSSDDDDDFFLKGPSCESENDIPDLSAESSDDDDFFLRGPPNDSEDDIPDLSAESSDDDDFFLNGPPNESEDDIPDLSADDEDSDEQSMPSDVSYFLNC